MQYDRMCAICAGHQHRRCRLAKSERRVRGLARGALQGDFVALLSVALALEYEAVCSEPAQRVASGLSQEDVQTVVSAICGAEPVVPRFLWRPQLRDPADEMVLETAINGNADAVVTFNRRDYGDATHRFGIDLLCPQDALKRVRQ